MTTHHRHHAPFWTAARERSLYWSAAVMSLLALGLVGSTYRWVWWTCAGLVAAGGVGYAIARPREVRRYLRLRAFWRREQLPPLPALPDLDKPFDLPPPDPSIFLEYSDMTAIEITTSLPAVVNAPAEPMSREEARAVEPSRDLAVPAGAATRWLTVREMRPGDVFVLSAAVAPLELRRVDWPSELQPVDMAMVAVEGLPLPLTLPAAQRWRMVRAERQAAVRCLVCGEGVQELGEHAYDLATLWPTATVTAICSGCEKVTAGDLL